MNPSIRLLGLGLSLTALGLAALVWVNPTHFTSVDSGYYLQSADSLLTGRGYVIAEAEQWVWNGIFPPGYPALIALFANLTGLPVLWASKVVNILAVMVSARRWQRRLGTDRMLWLFSIWWLGGFLRILVYTWSETVFLVLLAEWVWALNNLLGRPGSRQMAGLLLLSIGLFLIRYVGGYVVGVMALLVVALNLIPRRTQTFLRVNIPPGTGRTLVIIAGLTSAGITAYGWLNSHFTGSLYGGERFLPTESTLFLLALFAQSIGNELLLIRDFLPDAPNQLAWIGAVFQLIWLWLVYRHVQRHPFVPITRSDPASLSLSRLLILTGSLYILVLFGLRTVSPFSGPNARLMAPATFCFLMAFFVRLGDADPVWQRRFRPYWITLLICSWLQLLPQVDIDAKIRLVQSWIR